MPLHIHHLYVMDKEDCDKDVHTLTINGADSVKSGYVDSLNCDAFTDWLSGYNEYACIGREEESYAIDEKLRSLGLNPFEWETACVLTDEISFIRRSKAEALFLDLGIKNWKKDFGWIDSDILLDSLKFLDQEERDLLEKEPDEHISISKNQFRVEKYTEYTIKYKQIGISRSGFDPNPFKEEKIVLEINPKYYFVDIDSLRNFLNEFAEHEFLSIIERQLELGKWEIGKSFALLEWWV